MKKYVKAGITTLIVIALIVGCYYFVAHRDEKAAEDDVEITQVHEVLSKRLDTTYPPTPREVVKFYNRIIECAYGSEYDSAQFGQLTDQARKLLDDELLENNPQSDYKMRLQKEVDAYKDNSAQIIQTRVCDSADVQFEEIEGRKCAYVDASYFIKEGKGEFTKTYQSYLLRQDAEGKWKILAYHLTNAKDDL